jgi:6-phosphogluconolactonase
MRDKPSNSKTRRRTRARRGLTPTRSCHRLMANDPAALQFPPKYGPRHLVFSKDARRAYLLSELTAKLATLGWDGARGSLSRLAETSALPPGYAGPPSGAELALSRDGRFLYASNRAQSNTITAFRIGSDGLPAVIGNVESGGQTPRFIVIDPSDRFVLAANQDSNNIAVFRIDAVSGALTRERGQSSLPAPVDIVFQPRTVH